MKLYEVAAEGRVIEHLLEESGGELTPELESRFDTLLREGKDKVHAALCVLRNLEADAEAARNEANRLWALAEAEGKKADSLKNLIAAAVDGAFSGKLKTPLFSCWTQKSADTYEYHLAADVDLAELAEHQPEIVRTTRELNKSALNELNKAGQLGPEIVPVPRPGKRFLRYK